MSEKDIRRYSARDLRARRAAGESRSNFDRVRRKSEAELERDIATDDDFKGVSDDWYKDAAAVVPAPKKLLSLRIDNDVVDWFKRQGPGYQTRMNAVLRAFMRHARGGRA
jgi:uncharacterized protein (DUF4415 family)